MSKVFKTVTFENSWLVLCLDRDKENNIRAVPMGLYKTQSEALKEAATFRFILSRSDAERKRIEEKLEAVR